MKTLTISPELQNLLPTLSESEYTGLKEDILKHGCLSPIVVWGDVIVDGHNRYDICHFHTIPYEIKAMEFDSIDDAKLWAWQHQEHRRNLTPYQRIQIALQFKPMLEAQSKENQRLAGGDKKSKEAKSVLQTCATPISEKVHVRDKLADIAGVSHETLRKGEFLHEHANEDVKENLCHGQTSINKEYQRVKKAIDRDVVYVPVSPGDPNRLRRRVYKRINLSNISLVDTCNLVYSVMSWFDVSYRKQYVPDLLDSMVEHDGEEVVREIFEYIKQKYNF